MKLFEKTALFFMIFTSLAFTACSINGDDEASDAVVFQSAVQIGGASGTTDSTGLTLTFTIDPKTLSADNITVTGATKGSLSGSGTTRILAISSITVANGATVSVTITNPTGYLVSGSTQTAVVYKVVPHIGMPYQGGIVAYILSSSDPGYIRGETHGLVSAIEDQSTGIAWITGGTENLTQSSWVNGSGLGGTATALGTGQANTNAIKGQTDYTGGAAKVCDDYINADSGTGVYSDWFLPSKDELDKLFYNSDVIGGFANGYYWSSSESNNSRAWVQNPINGDRYAPTKDSLMHVRAVRTF